MSEQIDSIKKYHTPSSVMLIVRDELDTISSRSYFDKIVVHDDLDKFLSAEISYRNGIIEIVLDDPPLTDEARVGNCVEYSYFLKIAIRAKEPLLLKLKDIYGSSSAGMWRLFKEVNLKIGRTNLGNLVDYPEDTAISNIVQDFQVDEYVLSFDWYCRVITSEMSL